MLLLALGGVLHVAAGLLDGLAGLAHGAVHGAARFLGGAALFSRALAAARNRQRQAAQQGERGGPQTLVAALCLRKPRKNLRGAAGTAGFGLGAGFLICGAKTAASCQSRWPGSKRRTKRRPSSTISS